MARSEKNSAKVPIFRAIIDLAAIFGEVVSSDIVFRLGEMGYVSNESAIGMNLKRYRTHGWVRGRREGRRYFYSPNDTTRRMFEYLTAKHNIDSHFSDEFFRNRALYLLLEKYAALEDRVSALENRKSNLPLQLTALTRIMSALVQRVSTLERMTHVRGASHTNWFYVGYQAVYYTKINRVWLERVYSDGSKLIGPGITPHHSEPIKIGPVQFESYPTPEHGLEKYREIWRADPESAKLVKWKLTLDRFVRDAKDMMADTTYATEALKEISKIGNGREQKAMSRLLRSKAGREFLRVPTHEELSKILEMIEKLDELRKTWNDSVKTVAQP